MAQAEEPLTKVLVLHIEVPGLYVEDIKSAAADWLEDGESLDEAIYDIVVEEMMRPEVGVTFVTQPGEKCLNSEFDVDARTCQIVGAEVRDVCS